MVIGTSEYIFTNPINNEINNIIETTILEHNKKYADNYCRKIEFKYDIQFFDNIKKNITTNRGRNRTIIASQGRYELVKIKKLIGIIEGTIKKNVINTYMKSNDIPLLRRKLFLNIANNRDYVYNYCNRPFKKFHRHCREWYFYNNTTGDDIRMLNDEMKNDGAYW